MLVGIYMPIKVLITENYEEMSKKAAKIIANSVRKKPNIVLGLAAGETFVGCYKKLVFMHQQEGLDFSKVVTFNLDEYLGLGPTYSQSYRYFMDENLFRHVNIRRENIHVLDGISDNPKKVCEEFEEAIKKRGGIDLQLLGIGRNGHIAFNEPGSKLDSRTRVVSLSEQTINDNVRLFKSIEVPHQAVTMGIGTIMEASEILLLASGESKAEAVAKSLEGPTTTDVPASVLQRHYNCTFILDKTSASKLTQKTLGRRVWKNS